MELFKSRTRVAYTNAVGDKVYPVVVDIKKGIKSTEDIQFVSSDVNTGILSVAFISGNENFNVSGADVVCSVMRPDASTLELPCEVVRENIVEVPLGINGTSQDGVYSFDFKVLKGGNKIVGTPIMNYSVSLSIGNDMVIEEDDRLPVLTMLMTQLTELKDETREAINQVNVATEASREATANAVEATNNANAVSERVSQETATAISEIRQDTANAIASMEQNTSTAISTMNQNTANAIANVNATSDTMVENVNNAISSMDTTVNSKISEMTNTVNNKISEMNTTVNNKISEVDTAKNDMINDVSSTKANMVTEVTNAKNEMTTTVTNKVNEVEGRFNALTASQQQSSEVIDARDGETSLKARLDRDIEKAKQVYVNVEGSHISTDSSSGYAKDVEILGNTVQDASNLADIRSVGDKVEGQELYEIPVLSRGKNLFDGVIIDKALDVVTGSLFDSADWSTTNYIRVNSDKITFSTNTSVSEINNLNFTIVMYDTNYNIIGNVGFYNNNSGTWTLIPNTKYIRVRLPRANYSNIQIEEGTVATPYEPYIEDKITILSPVQLEKVGDVADRIVCKDGIWGVEKNVVDTILNGNENWSYSSTTKEFILSSSIYNHLQYSKGGRCISDKLEYSDSTTSTKDNVISVGNSAFLTIRKDIYTNLTDFKKYLSENNILVKYPTTQPQFIPLPHDQQIKLRTFASKTNISFLTEIEGTIKAQVPKSLGATVNTHTEQISNLNKELYRVKKLEESTVSTVETESDFTTVEATSNGYFEDVKLEGKTLVAPTIHPINNVEIKRLFHLGNLKKNTIYTVVNPTTDKIAVYEYDSWENAISEGYIAGNYTFNSLNNTSATVYFRGDVLPKGVFVVEGDHTQNPPQYFEGLKSVGDTTDEISVKSVNGDGNLVDFIEVGGTIGSSGDFGVDYNNKIYFRSNYINVQGLNTISYSFSHKDKTLKDPLWAFYDKNKKGIPPYRIGVTVDVPSSAKYVRFEGQLNDVSDTTPYINDINLMINKGDVPKPYTPRKLDKKRLLYYNDETQSWKKPILRQWDSIEKHADGKYYYHQRSVEVGLNGSEGWSLGSSSTDTTLLLYVRPSEVPKSYTWGICDKFNFQITNDVSIRNTEYIYVDTDINIRIAKSKLPTQNIAGFKQWLQANNVTVVYQLAQEKVYECTNVDLITYNGETNYVVESGAIVPRTTLKVHNNISNVVSLLQKKVSLLESNIKASQEVQDMMILETDMRMLDIELALMEFAPMTLNLGGSNMLRSATYFNFLKNHIINETYEKEYLENVMNKYLATGRINQDEYDELYKMLYPPVYDIELPIEL